MSQLRTPEEVLDKIEQDAGRYETQDPREHRRWVKVQIAAAQEQYPFMRDKTSADYIHYHVRKDASEIEAANAGPPPTSQPRTLEEFFDKMEQDMGRYQDLDIREHIRQVDAQIAAAQERYPFLRGKTSTDFFHHHVRKSARAKQAANAGPPPTIEDFWKAAYEFDPLGPNPSSEPSALQKLLTTGRLGLIPLGKLYGSTMLKLLPRIGALPTSAMPDEEPAFDFAATDSGAISYPDGHPPGAIPPSQSPDPATSSNLISNPIPRTRASTDDKLRRFASLGWVMQETSRDTWKKTGHVLVMDMDDRSLRHRQPWFVLASEWPTDGEETQEGDFTFYAQKRVLRNDRGVYGVFPGDNNRTPICAIWPYGRKPKEGEVILKQFGENFIFEPARFGGHRFAKPSRLGPSLARVMDWYWDPEAKQEVCYTEAGLEYMRYDRATGEYSFPDFSRIEIGGEQGLFGELEDVATLEVDRPLERRLTGLSLQDSTPQPGRGRFERSRMTSTAEGF